MTSGFQKGRSLPWTFILSWKIEFGTCVKQPWKKGASCLATKLWLKILTLLWKKTLTFGKQRPTLSERPLEPIIRDLRPLFSLFHSFRQGAVGVVLKSPRHRSGWTDCWCKLRPRAVPVPAKKREKVQFSTYFKSNQNWSRRLQRVFVFFKTYLHTYIGQGG